MSADWTEIIRRLHAAQICRPEQLSELEQMAASDEVGFSPESAVSTLKSVCKLTDFQANEICHAAQPFVILGSYAILDRVGQGGMGEVFRARHLTMNRIVALKTLSRSKAHSEDTRRRFRREVLAAARLRHPNIVTAYDADESEGTDFLVMEYIPGIDLHRLVSSQGPLSPGAAVNCILQAAAGLQYAQQQGVVHRDIKPANLLLDSAGTVRILDMGLARLSAEHDGESLLTSANAIMGTVDFMAPEQALNPTTADHRSDQYSLGFTLWFLLTGRKPFPGDSPLQRLMAHQKNAPPDLLAVVPDISPELQRHFHRMVARNPDDRFQSFAELRDALSPFADESPELLILEGIDEGSSTAVNALLETIPASAPQADIFRRHPSLGLEHPDITARRRRRRLVGVVTAIITVGVLLLNRRLSEPNERLKPEDGVAEHSSPPSALLAVTTRPPAPTEAIDSAAGESVSRPMGLYFDGIDDYILTPYAHNTEGPFTLEVWATLLPPVSSKKLTLLSNAESAGFSFAVNGDREVQFYVSSSSRQYEDHTPPGEVEFGQRVHLAAVCDGHELRTYLNGQQLGTATSMPNPPFPSPFLMLVGANPDPRLPGRRVATIREPFHGWIDEVRVTQRARYTENFEPEHEFTSDADTVLLYHLAEGVGDQVVDSSSAGNNGQITGADWVAPGELPERELRIKDARFPLDPDRGAMFAPENGYASGSPPARFNAIEPFTIEAWVTHQGIVSDEEGKALNTNSTIFAMAGVSCCLNLKLKRWQLNCYDPGQSVFSGIFEPADLKALEGRLTHVCVVWDGAQAKMYIDGRPCLVQPTGDGKGNTGPPLDELLSRVLRTAGLNLLIGARSTSAEKAEPFRGIYHQFRISQGVPYTEGFEPSREWKIDSNTLRLFTFTHPGSGDLFDQVSQSRVGKIARVRWVAPAAAADAAPAEEPMPDDAGNSDL